MSVSGNTISNKSDSSKEYNDFLSQIEEIRISKNILKYKNIIFRAISYSRFDLVHELISYGFKNLYDRNEQGFNIFDLLLLDNTISHSKVKLILTLIFDKFTTSKDNKKEKYEFDKANLISIHKNGTYGSILYDLKYKYTVKKSNSRNYNKNLLREYMIIKTLNQINPKMFIDVKEISYSEGKLYLVLDELFYSLEEIFTLLQTINFEMKSRYYIFLYQAILKSLNVMHSVGIIHRDIKPSNVMVDFNGVVKLIDFGISEFVGIKKLPSKFMSNRSYEFQGTFEYMAPDSDTLVSLIVSEGKEIILENNNHNYSSDLYSLGVLIMNSIFGYEICLYFQDIYNERKVYYFTKNTNQERYNKKCVLKLVTEDMITRINKISPHLLDLLYHLFDTDSLTRYTAKQALEHPIFSDSSLNTSHNLNNSQNINSIITKKISYIPNSLYSIDEIRFKRGELQYGEEIYNYYMQMEIPTSNIDSYTLEVVQELYSSNEIAKMDFDVIFNFYIIITSLYQSVDDSILKIYFNNHGSIIIDDMNDTIKMLKSLDKFSFISIKSVIEYYVTMLQFNSFPSYLISRFRQHAYSYSLDVVRNSRSNKISIENLINAILLDITAETGIPIPIF